MTATDRDDLREYIRVLRAEIARLDAEHRERTATLRDDLQRAERIAVRQMRPTR